MSKPENKKSLLHKINDVFEDYVVGKLGDIDVLESVEALSENTCGSDSIGSDCNSADLSSGEAQRMAVDAERHESDLRERSTASILPSADGWAATPLPEKRAEEAACEASAFESGVGAVHSSDHGIQTSTSAVAVGTVRSDLLGRVEKPDCPTSAEEDTGDIRQEGATQKRESFPDSAVSAVRGAEDVTEASLRGASEELRNIPCGGKQGNACPEDFDALWNELACLRAGFTELMTNAYYKDVGSLREMQRKIREMQLILQAIAERNGYVPPEISGECNLPVEYGYALRVMRERVLRLYDCMMEIVFRSRGDYDMVVLCMTLMRIAAALEELM